MLYLVYTQLPGINTISSTPSPSLLFFILRVFEEIAGGKGSGGNNRRIGWGALRKTSRRRPR